MDTSHLAEHAGAAGSFFASIFVVATLSMRTMIPLRVFGILTNIILITTAIPTHNYATLILHSVLLPLNTYRLHQMLQLVRNVKKSVNSDLSMEWLKPFMTERKCATGEVLFYKDEKADSMFYIVSGRFRLVESGIELPVGAIVGEFGMLSPSNARTQTLECIEGGVILSVSYDQVEQLYVQNPAFGFYFLRLVSARLFQNIETLEQRLARHTAAPVAAEPKPALSIGSAGMVDDGLLSSFRYLFADFLGEEDDEPPFLPEGLPETVAPVVSDAIHILVDHQSLGYARLYVDRVRRFVGRHGVDEVMLADIARLMAMRMAYEDPIRIAQLKLAELDEASGGLPMKSVDDVRKFRLDEMVGALPAAVAGPLLNALGRIGWLRKRVPMRFSTRSNWGIRRLKMEAALRRWRLFSVRYATERVWVERWLHMIDRALTRHSLAAPSVIETATMIQGYGDPYRQGMADWHAIVDGLVKPTFDGVLALPDLAGAITEARAAALPDPRQAALKRKIAEIRARLPAGATAAAGGG